MGILRQGKRLEKKRKVKYAKISWKHFKEIIAVLDQIAERLYNLDIKEEELIERVAEISDIKLDRMEISYLMKKMEGLRNENKGDTEY